MKIKYLLCAAICCMALGAAAQKIDKAYVSRPQDNGMLYHILPMEMMKDKYAAVPMDFTRLSTVDSVTLNYTLTRTDTVSPDSVAFTRGTMRKVYPTKKIFVEASKKKDWTYRYTIVMPLNDMADIFRNANSTTGMTVYSGGQGLEYNQSGDWKSNTEILQKIILMMRQNAD